MSRKNKCVSVILNKYTKKRDDGPKSSRGKLCVDNLKNHSEFANKLRNDCAKNLYSPFFLLNFDFAGPLSCSYYTCGTDGKLKHKEITGSGFCGHSNSSMERPWVKTNKGVQMFEEAITESLNKTAESSKMQIMRDLKAQLLKVMTSDRRHENIY